MRYVLLTCLLGFLVAGCVSDFLIFGNDDDTGDIRFENAADRPFAVVVFNAENRHLIDPYPAYSVEQFAERKIDVGASAIISGNDRGKDAYILIYAQCDCELSAWIKDFAGTNAAILTKSFEISADALKLLNYRVVIENL
jgi:hypothetical protein